MKCNVGGMDRWIRIIVGIALVAYAFFAKQPIAYIGVIPLVTGLAGFCLIYPIFKFSTCSKKD